MKLRIVIRSVTQLFHTKMRWNLPRYALNESGEPKQKNCKIEPISGKWKSQNPSFGAPYLENQGRSGKRGIICICL